MSPPGTVRYGETPSLNASAVAGCQDYYKMLNFWVHLLYVCVPSFLKESMSPWFHMCTLASDSGINITITSNTTTIDWM